MKKISVLAVVLIALLTGTAISQGDGDAAKQAEQMKMMQKWMELLKPNEHHERLAKMIGVWDTESEIHMEPGQPPQKGKGKAVMTWAIKGKVVMQKYDGTFMGMPEQGVGLHGYDNYKKKHWAIWTSNMGPGVLTMEGVTVDPTHKINVLYGPMDEPMTGEHDKPVKYVTRFLDDDHAMFEIWDLGQGENGRMVIKIDYKRSKGEADKDDDDDKDGEDDGEDEDGEEDDDK